MTEAHDFGRDAEDYAARFLAAKGYRILQQNWRCGHLELDIICIFESELVIVEVKARRQTIFPFPEDVLSIQKERFIIHAAEAFIFSNGFHIPVRFDLIAVIFHDGGYEIEHIENAFFPGVE